jgi:aspartokinase
MNARAREFVSKYHRPLLFVPVVVVASFALATNLLSEWEDNDHESARRVQRRRELLQRNYELQAQIADMPHRSRLISMGAQRPHSEENASS